MLSSLNIILPSWVQTLAKVYWSLISFNFIKHNFVKLPDIIIGFPFNLHLLEKNSDVEHYIKWVSRSQVLGLSSGGLFNYSVDIVHCSNIVVYVLANWIDGNVITDFTFTFWYTMQEYAITSGVMFLPIYLFV